MEISQDDINRAVQQAISKGVRKVVASVDTQAKACAVRAANQLQNAAILVLRGKRSGRQYKRPRTKTYYTASAPGEPPAVRTGMLRMSWGMSAEGDGKGNYKAGIFTDVPYAELLEEGTPNGKVEPRPYKEKIIERAKPKVIEIFSELETK